MTTFGLITEGKTDQIIFAIAVHSIECWLLPLYYTNQTRAKTKNCLDTLNRQLKKADGFSINPSQKNPRYYETISKKYCKHKTLVSLYKANPSLRIFVEAIEARNIVIGDQ